MKAGIVGFPASGRRTLFNLLTRAEAGNSRGIAKLGTLRIPDERLNEVARIQGSKKATPANIELFVIPGLVKGESREKLNLSAIRNLDVLIHVVRAFRNSSVSHPEGSVDPVRDIEVMDLELMLADLGVVDKRLERLRSDAGKGVKPDPRELAALERARDTLSRETPLRSVLNDEERKTLRGYALLTAKPRLLVVNVGEDEIGLDWTENSKVKRQIDTAATTLCSVSARIEAEIAELTPEDAKTFREDLGLTGNTVERIVKATFALMGMITFFTGEEKETRAWIVPRGTKAVTAAGSIHSDMERGFIRAEVVPFEVLAEEGSWSGCREKGLVRLEGKSYLVEDGDVVYFRFHV
jgi:GTP-binding protein YchF